MSRTNFSPLPLLLLCFLSGYGNPSPDGTVIDVGSKKQLFIDDLFIASWHGIRLTVNPPQKTRERNLVPDPDRPWEAVRVAYPCTVMEDQGKYRMWYDAMHHRQPEDQLPYRVVCYAESDDGIHWRKPIVGAFEFRGSKQNNISIPTAPGSVFIDPDAPPEERYKYFGRNRVAMLKDRVAGAGSWIYASADGLSFKPLYGRPATRQISDTHDVAFWDPVIGKYAAYTKYVGHFDSRGALVRPELPTGVRKGRKIWRMTTDRLDRWPAARIVLAMDAEDRRDADFYNSAAIRYAYADRAYFVFPSAYYHFVGETARRNDGPMDIQLAVSRDGVHFSRPSRSPFVRRGREGSYDGGHMYMGRGMLRRGDELWMYYVGFDYTHGDRDALDQGGNGVISRLVLRLDGFVSADADYGGGEIISRPIRFQGDRLELNMDAGAGGSVRVALLDPEGEPIPGYTLEESQVMGGNSVRRLVTWKKGSDLSALSGRPVRLHWKLRDVKLYAFQFREQHGDGGAVD